MWKNRRQQQLEDMAGVTEALWSIVGIFYLLNDKQRRIAVEILGSNPPPESLTPRGIRTFHQQMTQILMALDDPHLARNRTGSGEDVARTGPDSA